ncbi:hypothetical protein FOA52_004149 [Chlamydomonas sp. UWO 241]|nr:hypothetical protein FOA52_004149 [Chlamydomonas sp. UWO 241]
MQVSAAMHLLPILKNAQRELESYYISYGDTVRLVPKDSDVKVPNKQKNIDFILSVSKDLANYSVAKKKIGDDATRNKVFVGFFTTAITGLLTFLFVALVWYMIVTDSSTLDFVVKFLIVLISLIVTVWLLYLVVQYTIGYFAFLKSRYNVYDFEHNGNTIPRLLKILELSAGDDGKLKVGDAHSLYLHYVVAKYGRTIFDDSVVSRGTEEQIISDHNNLLFPFDGSRSIDPFVLKKELDRFDIYEQRVLFDRAFYTVNMFLNARYDVATQRNATTDAAAAVAVDGSLINRISIIRTETTVALEKVVAAANDPVAKSAALVALAASATRNLPLLTDEAAMAPLGTDYVIKAVAAGEAIAAVAVAARALASPAGQAVLAYETAVATCVAALAAAATAEVAALDAANANRDMLLVKVHIAIQRRAIEIMLGVTLPPRPADDDYRGKVVVTSTPQQLATLWTQKRSEYVARIVGAIALWEDGMNDTDIYRVVATIDALIGSKSLYEGILTDILYTVPFEVENKRLTYDETTYITKTRFVEKLAATNSLGLIKNLVMPIERIRVAADSILVWNDIYNPNIMFNNRVSMMGTSLVFFGFLLSVVIATMAILLFRNADSDKTVNTVVVATTACVFAVAYSALWTSYAKQSTWNRFVANNEFETVSKIQRSANAALALIYNDMKNDMYGVRVAAGTAGYTEEKARYLKGQGFVMNPYYVFDAQSKDVSNDLLFDYTVNSSSIDSTRVTLKAGHRLGEVYLHLADMATRYVDVQKTSYISFPWTEVIGYSVLVTVCMVVVWLIVSRYELMQRLKNISYIKHLRRLYYSNNRVISESDMELLRQGIVLPTFDNKARAMYILGAVVLVARDVFKLTASPTLYPDVVVLTLVVAALLTAAWLATNRFLVVFVLLTSYGVLGAYLFKCLYFATKLVEHDGGLVATIADYVRESVWPLTPLFAMLMFNASLVALIASALRKVSWFKTREPSFRFALFTCAMAAAYASVTIAHAATAGGMTREVLTLYIVATLLFATAVSYVIEYIAHECDELRDARGYENLALSLWMMTAVALAFVSPSPSTQVLDWIRNAGICLWLLLAALALIPILRRLLRSEGMTDMRF